MIKAIKALSIIAIALCSFNFLHAQDDAQAPDSKNENIIIHKKDSVKEKVTVVIDGNSVSVNGKPIEDFISDNIEITKQIGDMDFMIKGALPPMPPMPPMQAFKDDMMHSIKSNNAFLGVMTEPADKGAKVTDVTEKSAADKAGLKEDDIITKVGNDKVAGPDDLYKSVGKHKPDEKVVIAYIRNGKEATVTVTLGKSDQMRVYSWNSPGEYNNAYKDYNHAFSFSWNNNKPHLGISAQDTEDGNGVKILDIDDDDSPAAKAGLQEDDIITQVNGKAITSTEDLKQSVKDAKQGDTIKVTYKRNNQTQTIDVKFPKDLKTIDL